MTTATRRSQESGAHAASPGLDEDLNQPADSVWRESQHARELADPDRLVIVEGQQ
ncbi:MAG TPA: hypothetical protein VE196_12970 [Pseudonocardiaceae bacterium]|nr:hypothetical protein [Pseudonocardiaceae bacterium]